MGLRGRLRNGEKTKSGLKKFGGALKSGAKTAYKKYKARDSPENLKKELTKQRLKAKIARAKASQRKMHAQRDRGFYGLYGLESPSPKRKKARKKKKPKKKVEYFY